MTQPRSYPPGVTSWVDIAAEDVGGATDFYGELFGWTFTDEPLPGDADRYLVAQQDGLDAAGILGARTHPSASGWNTYIAVDDVEAAIARVEGAGGHAVTAASQGGKGAGRWPAPTRMAWSSGSGRPEPDQVPKPSTRLKHGTSATSMRPTPKHRLPGTARCSAGRSTTSGSGG